MESVTVRRSGEVICTIDDVDELQTFFELWTAKTKLPKKNDAWTAGDLEIVKLTISSDRNSWIYNSANGTVWVLAKNLVPVYQLDRDGMNNLLGI